MGLGSWIFGTEEEMKKIKLEKLRNEANGLIKASNSCSKNATSLFREAEILRKQATNTTNLIKERDLMLKADLSTQKANNLSHQARVLYKKAEWKEAKIGRISGIKRPKKLEPARAY